MQDPKIKPKQIEKELEVILGGSWDDVDFKEDLDEDDIPELTLEEQAELARRLESFKNPSRYVIGNFFLKSSEDENIIDQIKTRNPFYFFYDALDDSYVVNEWGTKFKRKSCAVAVAKALSDDKERKKETESIFVYLVLEINKDDDFDFNNIKSVEVIRRF